jgi:DNA-binding transcriptional regulator GbsR (MarR family)
MKTKNYISTPQIKVTMNNLQEIEGELASMWEDMAEGRGFNRVVGRVLFTLMVKGRPLSQTEIVEETGYSLPTVSRALNTLVTLGTGKKTSTPGSRLRRYHVEARPQDLMVGGLTKWHADAENMYMRLSNMLEDVESLGEEEAKEAGAIKGFLTEMCGSLPKVIKIIEKAISDIGST